MAISDEIVLALHRNILKLGKEMGVEMDDPANEAAIAAATAAEHWAPGGAGWKIMHGKTESEVPADDLDSDEGDEGDEGDEPEDDDPAATGHKKTARKAKAGAPAQTTPDEGTGTGGDDDKGEGDTDPA